MPEANEPRRRGLLRDDPPETTVNSAPPPSADTAPSSTSTLLVDIAAVWPPGAPDQWAGELADALNERFPDRYQLDSRSFAAAVGALGFETSMIARHIDGQPISRQGLHAPVLPTLTAGTPQSSRVRLPAEVVARALTEGADLVVLGVDECKVHGAVAQALAEGRDLVVMAGEFAGEAFPEVGVDPGEGVVACPLVRAECHPLDDVIEAALDEWQDRSPVDLRTEGAVVRATLVDPANRVLVDAWLVEAGLAGGG